MRANRIVVHAPDHKGKGFAGRRTERFRLRPAAGVEIDMGMVPGNCGHGALLVACIASFADGADPQLSKLVTPAAQRSAHATRGQEPKPPAAAPLPPDLDRPEAVRPSDAVRAAAHIGGTIPRPTAIRGACTLPSGCGFAAATKIAALGFSSSLSPGTNETIGMSGGTTIFFSPSLYFTVST